MKKKSSPPEIFLAIACMIGALPCVATAETSKNIDLPDVIISATRSEQYTDDLAFTVDVLNRQTMERQQILDIRDTQQNQTNLSVRHAPARFALTGPANNTGREGNTGFNIRGMGSNRVLMLEDGIRIPHSYVYAGNAFGRDYVSLDMIERIEIVRGPASALYGSDGMGGLVNFVTLSPDIFLKRKSDSDSPVKGQVSIGWSGDSERKSIGTTLAGRSSSELSWLINLASANSQGLKNRGTNDAANLDRTTPNPQLNQDRSVLGKFVWTPSPDQKHTFTLAHVDRESDVHLLSSISKLPYTGSNSQINNAVLDEAANASMNRNRITLASQFDVKHEWADKLNVYAGIHNASSLQHGTTDLYKSADRVRDVSYSEASAQVGLQAEKIIRHSTEWTQKYIYGIESSNSNISNFYTGVSPLPPEVFPLKRFPDTRETTRSAYAQTEWLSDQWSMTPGVRIDHFALDVTSQNLFYPPAKQAGQSLADSAVSPKLGIKWNANAQWSAFAQYAEGFKAPNANQVNGYFELSPIPGNPNYVTIVANPKLQAERSKNLELGMRYRTPGLMLDAAIFSGEFNQLIQDLKALGGTGLINDPLRFQTVNIDHARISGFEVKGMRDLGFYEGGRLKMPFAYGQAKGHNTGNQLPLNSIDPSHFMLGLNYSKNDWDIKLDLHHFAAKRAQDIDSASLLKNGVTQFSVPSSNTLNASAQWQLQKQTRLTVAVYNLTQQKYWKWSDVQGVAASSTVLDAFTQPGRLMRFTLTSTF